MSREIKVQEGDAGEQKHKTVRWLPLVLFSISVGLMATLWGYNYSAGNAEEQLPFIFRAMHPGYLANDFFTNTFTQYGPRLFFSEFIALIARLLPLSATLFVLTLCANIAIAWLSSQVAAFFFPKTKFSHYFAAAAVLTVKTFWLGYSNVIYRNFLEPEHLAIPFVILGFLLILKRRHSWAAVSFGIAAIFHALLGLEFGWILFGCAFADGLIFNAQKKESRKPFRGILAGAAILALFSVGLLFPYALQGSVPSSYFIRLVAFVRHPHHYLPSYFSLWQYWQAAFYLIGFVFIFAFALKRSTLLRENGRFLYLIGGVILLLCIGGYLFVEVWPSRLWTAAQMFRLPYLIKWFSIVLIAAWIGEGIETRGETWSVFIAGAALLALTNPVTLALFGLIFFIRHLLQSHVSRRLLLWIDGVVLLFSVLAAIFYRPETRTWIGVLVSISAILILYAAHWKLAGHIIANALPLAASTLLLLCVNVIQPPALIKHEVPVFALYPTSGELADVAAYAKQNTPVDAIFYIPPKMGEFRYLADRAVVVDFVAFPFQDLSMQEWYLRIANCYGVASLPGFDSITQLIHTVYQLTDEELIRLSDLYDFQYAVVYTSTETTFPVLFHTTSLKLVQIQR